MDQSDVNQVIAKIRMSNQFLGLVDKYRGNDKITLSEVLKEFSEPYIKAGYNINTDRFSCQHQFISSLLVYIVLPKEKFWEDVPEIKIQDLPEGWGLNQICKDWDLKYFLRKMRNSIAHGNIDVTEALEFSFTDNNFKSVLNEACMHKFVQALAYWSLTKDHLLTKL